MFGSSDATEGVILDGQRSVLIVDSSEETQEVLRTALERRGMRILAANRAGPGLELAQEHHPDLIVLDLEVEDQNAENQMRREAVGPLCGPVAGRPGPASPFGHHAPASAPPRWGIRAEALPLWPIDS